jgi:endoglucanase
MRCYMTISFLRVHGSKVVDAQSRPVLLRGFCVGGWMNMENFINGYPGQESCFRSAVKEVLGEGKAQFFFDRMLDYFLAEDDIRYISELGANVVRLPFNYRHFEDDGHPMIFKKEGLARLDRMVALCRKYGIYVILDLHSAQGWQNPDWHSDNPTSVSMLWTQKVFQDRVIALWEHLARHYKDEPAVAGYNLINEPVCTVKGALPAFYRRLVAAVRRIDRRHILFLEGNWFSVDFSELSPDLDHNTVFSSHNYVAPSFGVGPYPGRTAGGLYNASRMKRDVLKVTGFMRRHRVPCWIGEFGSLYRGTVYDADRLKVMKDETEIFNAQGYHWTIWTYKDVGLMGTVTVSKDSQWMRRTNKVRALKDKLGLDLWGQRQSVTSRAAVRVVSEARRIMGSKAADWRRVQWVLGRLVGGIALSETLAKPFALQFKGMTEKQIDSMMQSFAYKNCNIREGLAEILRRQMKA